MSEIEQFKKVLDHPSYKANPMGTIAEHIRNVIQLQQEGGTWSAQTLTHNSDPHLFQQYCRLFRKMCIWTYFTFHLEVAV